MDLLQEERRAKQIELANDIREESFRRSKHFLEDENE